MFAKPRRDVNNNGFFYDRSGAHEQVLRHNTDLLR